jgi:hypothetical protein
VVDGNVIPQLQVDFKPVQDPSPWAVERSNLADRSRVSNKKEAV